MLPSEVWRWLVVCLLAIIAYFLKTGVSRIEKDVEQIKDQAKAHAKKLTQVCTLLEHVPTSAAMLDEIHEARHQLRGETMTMVAERRTEMASLEDRLRSEIEKLERRFLGSTT